MTDVPEWLPELDELEKQNDGFLRSGYSGDYYVKVGVMLNRLRYYITRAAELQRAEEGPTLSDRVVQLDKEMHAISRRLNDIDKRLTPVVIASHCFDELLQDGSSYMVRCFCGYVTPACTTPLGADNLWEAHFVEERNKANVPTAPTCEHNWRIRGTRWEETPSRVVADLYYCTRCLEHAERKR